LEKKRVAERGQNRRSDGSPAPLAWLIRRGRQEKKENLQKKKYKR